MDDIILVGNDIDEIRSIVASPYQTSKIKNLRDLTYFLGF